MGDWKEEKTIRYAEIIRPNVNQKEKGAQNMNMPKGFQIRKLQDELKRAGVSADLVDLHAMTDANLSYPENYKNIMGRYKPTGNAHKKGKQNRFGVSNIDFKYAHDMQQSRSPQSRAIDESQRHRRTYTEKQVSRRPGLLDSWFKNPGNSDIFGIDVFGFSKERKKRRK